MPTVPSPNDLVGHIDEDDTEVSTWYKVESIRYEFYREPGTFLDPGGGEVEYTHERENFGVAVYVSVVP